MIPIQNFATGVLAEVIRRQPASKERTSFAWQLAVGAALARVTAVELARDGVLTVTTRDPRWTREIKRSAGVILPRLQNLLGPEAVTRIVVDGSADRDSAYRSASRDQGLPPETRDQGPRRGTRDQ